MKLFARKRLYFLFRKNGQLVRVFLNKPKKSDYSNNWVCIDKSDDISLLYSLEEGDKLQLWTLVGRKYEFAKEYK